MGAWAGELFEELHETVGNFFYAVIATTVSGMKGARICEMKLVTTPGGAITEYRVRMHVSFVAE